MEPILIKLHYTPIKSLCVLCVKALLCDGDDGISCVRDTEIMCFTADYKSMLCHQYIIYVC